MFRDTPESGRWKADRLLVNGHGGPTRYVEISDEQLERGISSLEAHTVYLEALEDHPSPRELLTGVTTGGGNAAGDVGKAVLFTQFGM